MTPTWPWSGKNTQRDNELMSYWLEDLLGASEPDIVIIQK